MSDGPKLVPLGVQNEAAACLARLNRDIPFLLDHAVLAARVKRAYYEALVSEGFSEAQALELCKTSMGCI